MVGHSTSRRRSRQMIEPAYHSGMHHKLTLWLSESRLVPSRNTRRYSLRGAEKWMRRVSPAPPATVVGRCLRPWTLDVASHTKERGGQVFTRCVCAEPNTTLPTRRQHVRQARLTTFANDRNTFAPHDGKKSSTLLISQHGEHGEQVESPLPSQLWIMA